MKSKFVQLTRASDWGHVYLAEKPKAPPFGTADKSRGILTVEGQTVTVLWPDGSTTEEKIVHQKMWETVSDHGFNDTVESLIPGLNLKLNGAAVWLPLDHPGLKVPKGFFTVKESK